MALHVTPMDVPVCGWDIGGAHVKAVLVDGARRVQAVALEACPLWQGLDHLDRALGSVLGSLPLPPAAHAVTMTGEGCDLFVDRAEGVARILAHTQRTFGNVPLRVYTATAGLVSAGAAGDIASMNWHAMASALAAVTRDALLVDIGSTTTDVLLVRDGRLRAQGLDDRGRYVSDELVYQGVARTPIMALAQRVPYRGAWQGIAAEHFATMADVYRVLDALPADADLMPSADGRPKTVRDSAARLARMVGEDLDDDTLPAIVALARWLRGTQLMRLEAAARRVLGAARPPLVVGAGVGRFLVRELAASLGLAYADYTDALGVRTAMGANDCAPALAVACLGLVP